MNHNWMFLVFSLSHIEQVENKIYKKTYLYFDLSMKIQLYKYRDP